MENVILSKLYNNTKFVSSNKPKLNMIKMKYTILWSIQVTSNLFSKQILELNKIILLYIQKHIQNGILKH